MLGSSPKESEQPQNMLVRVESWTWISRPITASSCSLLAARCSGIASGPGCEVEADRLLERVGGVKQLALVEGGRGDLEADRQPGAAAWRLGEAGGNRDRRDPRQGHRHREVVVEVHRQRVPRLLAQPEGDRWRGRGDD